MFATRRGVSLKSGCLMSAPKPSRMFSTPTAMSFWFILYPSFASSSSSVSGSLLHSMHRNLFPEKAASSAWSMTATPNSSPHASHVMGNSILFDLQDLVKLHCQSEAWMLLHQSHDLPDTRPINVALPVSCTQVDGPVELVRIV